MIGHHCDLTGVFTSWGYWHDKAAKIAVDLINKGGGIAGRKVELATEDTESNPASGARKLRNLIERSNAEFIVGVGAFRHHAGRFADRIRTQDDLLLDRRVRATRPVPRARGIVFGPEPTPIRSPRRACRGLSKPSARNGRCPDYAWGQRMRANPN